MTKIRSDVLPSVLEALPFDAAALMLRQGFVWPNDLDHFCHNPLDAGRFTNHASNPNMGEVTLRDVAAGEELTIDYSFHGNPDWYVTLCEQYGVLTESQVAEKFK